MAEILPISASDHFPITLNIVEPTKPFRNAFKCEKMWFLDTTFMEHIKKWWNDDRPQGSKMFCLITKMKNLKRKIKEWNKEHFKNIFKTKIEIEEELNLLNNEVISKGMDNNKYIKEKELMIKHEEILAKEETFWRQKSCEKWLGEGDRNTKFFHNSTLQNRNLRLITHIKDKEGNMISEPSKLNDELIKYFRECLNNYDTSDLCTQREMLQGIPKIISDDDNIFLNKPFTLEEIKAALFSINPDKSPARKVFKHFFTKNAGI